jgi:hypothetical protein
MLQFDGPKFVYDVGKAGLSTTAHCHKCHKQTYYCQHQIAYCANNPELKKVFEQKKIKNYPSNSIISSKLTVAYRCLEHIVFVLLDDS